MAARVARGRPRARDSIVDAVLPADVLLELNINDLALSRVCGNALGVLQWLAQHGLIIVMSQ